MIELKEIPIVEEDEPLSKAIAYLMEPCPIVGVVKDKKLIGIIDDRHLSIGRSDVSSIKAGSVAVKSPKIQKIGNILEVVKKFSQEHFKALPVVGKDLRPVGYYSRVEILKTLVENGLIEKVPIEEIMTKEIYTIESSSTLGEAKRKMKDLKVKRLVVTEKDKAIGVISTFDFVGLRFKSLERQSKQLIKSVEKIEKRQIKEFLREPLLLLPINTDLLEAAVRMIEKNVSYAIIVEDLGKNKPLGIITARDIFKWVLNKYEKKELEIVISGLSDEDMFFYNDIKDSLRKVAEKIKSEKIAKIFFNVKKEKSVYDVNAKVVTANNVFHFSSQHQEIMIAVKELVDKIKKNIIKEKEKRIRKQKEETLE